jgi:CDP-diglyceride synthetase
LQSKDFNSAHQIIGLIVILFVLVQFSLGMLHHRLYKRSQQPTTFGRIHRYIGFPVLLFGAIDGFLGFDLADEDHANIWYGVIVGVMLLALAVALFWARRRRKGKAAALERDNASGRDSYDQFQRLGGAGGNIPLRNVRGGK